MSGNRMNYSGRSCWRIEVSVYCTIDSNRINYLTIKNCWRSAGHNHWFYHSIWLGTKINAIKRKGFRTNFCWVSWTVRISREILVLFIRYVFHVIEIPVIGKFCSCMVSMLRSWGSSSWIYTTPAKNKESKIKVHSLISLLIL